MNSFTQKTTYSFIVSIYNDGYLAAPFCESFYETFEKILAENKIEQQVELIFVNDGSTDNSLEQVKSLHQKYPFIKIIDLSRNFGQHQAIACGYREASGNFIGRLNIDMQDPPSEIPKLLETLSNNSNIDIVIGLQENIRYNKLSDRITSRLFFIFFNWLTGQQIPYNTASLRIMSRRFINEYNTLEESYRFPQGIENWIGLNKLYVPIKHQPRSDKKSSYTFSKRLVMALMGSISFSDRPLKIVLVFGILIALAGFLFVVYILLQKLLFDNIIPGYASIISFVVLLFGVQIGVIGLSGLYLGQILREVQKRPLYIIREKINF